MEQLTRTLDGREEWFIKYHRYYYRVVDFKQAPILLLIPCKKDYKHIDYKLGDKTFKSLMTTTLSWLPIKTLVRGHYVRYRVIEKYKKLSIFDLEEIE
jgi:hypothetical protein